MKRAVVILLLAGPLGVVAVAGASGGSGDRASELHEAAREGDTRKVAELLDAGVPVDAPARHGVTALRLAADRGQLETVELLVARGANIDAEETFFGTSVLAAALGQDRREVALVLLARGAKDAASALQWAIEADDLEVAKSAVALGVDALDLAVARRAAAAKSEGLRQLLASATAKPRAAAVVGLDAARLSAYAGTYRGDTVVVVSVVGDSLSLTFEGATVGVRPTGERRFETESGDLRFEVAGRAGLVEWAQLTRASGEVSFLSAVSSSEPGVLARAADAPLETARRTPARPWRQFRGTGASGIGDGQGAPAGWDLASGHNVRFKTPVPGIALASPIIDGDRIFVATAVSSKGDTTFRTGLYGDGDSVEDTSEHSFRLYALDSNSGAIVWQREVHRAEPTVRRHLKSSLANSTPVTDGERVVVLFGMVGQLAAYDRDGKELWRRDVGVLEANDPQSGTAEWGHAASPVIWQDLVFVQADRRRDSFLAAYRLATGEEVWRVARDEPSTWSTPTVVSTSDGDELVTNGTTIRAYRPRTGELLWHLTPNSEVVVATPVAGDAAVYLTAGYPPVRPVYAVRTGFRGDLSLAPGLSSSPAVAWSHSRGGTYLPTPILYRGFLVTLANNGILTAYRADTGEEVHRARVAPSGTSFSASPVAADGRLYLTSEEGEVFVLRGEPGYELLAQLAMGEVVMATPAISDGLMVIRTLGHVVGLAEQPVEATAEGPGN